MNMSLAQICTIPCYFSPKVGGQKEGARADVAGGGTIFLPIVETYAMFCDVQ